MDPELTLSRKALAECREKAVEGLEQFLKESGSRGFILGLSGGIDSSVTAALAVETGKKVYGLIMPDSVTGKGDAEDARKLAEKLGVRCGEINLEETLESIENNFPWKAYGKKRPMCWGNVKARLRMTLNYLGANQKNLLVLGTGNKTELLLGYYTKYGDGGADLLPIGGLYKTRVRQLARKLRLPKKIIEKPPTAGLWLGQTDEEELGLDYESIDTILYLLTEQWMSVEEAAGQAGVKKTKVEDLAKRIQANRHKLEPTHIIPLFD